MVKGAKGEENVVNSAGFLKKNVYDIPPDQVRAPSARSTPASIN